MLAELLIAVALLAMAVLPLAYSITSEKTLARARYQRAVAMEIVDGEMEVLVAGDWRAFEPGRHEYPIHAQAAANLPPGHFWLTVKPGSVRLEWQPAETHHGGPVAREAEVK